MNGFAHRLDQLKLEIGDQADYLQHLLDQFDMPYDVFCSLQGSVDELRVLSRRIGRSAHAVVASPVTARPRREQ